MKRRIYPRYFPHQGDRTQSGNIFAILFGAVAMIGVMGVVGVQQISGPISTITSATQKNKVDTELTTAAKIIIVGAAEQANNGDCDADGYVEPAEYRTTTGPKPTSGGLLPNTIGASLTDPWGTEYGYCVWDHATVNHAGCGGGTQKRLAGPNPPQQAQPVIAIIAAGPDKAFQTTCRVWADSNNDGIPNSPLVEKTVGSDDFIVSFTYAQAAGVVDGLWGIKTGGTTTAEIQKSLEVQNAGSATVSVDASTGIGDFMGLTTDTILAKTGGLVDAKTTLKLGKTVGTDENDMTGIDNLIGYNDIRMKSSAASTVQSMFKPTGMWLLTENAATTALGNLQLGQGDQALHSELFLGTGSGGQCRVWSMGTRYGNASYTSPFYDFIVADRGCDGTSDTRRMVINYNDGYIGLNTDNPISRLHLNSGSTTSLGGPGYMTLGPVASNNVNLDNTSINARDNGAAAMLYLQANGGELQIQRNLATSSEVNIDEMGAVGLGIQSPLEKLDNSGDMVLRGGDIYFSNDSGTNSNNDYMSYVDTNNQIATGSGGVVLITADRPRGEAWTAARGGFAVHSAFVLTKLGVNAQTPQEAVDVVGDVKAVKMNVTSDARLKTDISPLRARVDGIDLARKIRPVSYEWKDKSMGTGEQIGVLAQDIEKFMPYAVGGSEESKAVNYIELLPVLTRTIQDQQATLADKAAIIAAQNEEIETLKSRLEGLMAAQGR